MAAVRPAFGLSRFLSEDEAGLRHTHRNVPEVIRLTQS